MWDDTTRWVPCQGLGGGGFAFSLSEGSQDAPCGSVGRSTAGVRGASSRGPTPPAGERGAQRPPAGVQAWVLTRRRHLHRGTGSDQRGPGSQQKTGVLIREPSVANGRRSGEKDVAAGELTVDRVLGGRASRVRCPESKAKTGRIKPRAVDRYLTQVNRLLPLTNRTVSFMERQPCHSHKRGHGTCHCVPLTCL